MKIRLVKTGRNEFQISVIQSFDCSLCHLVHLYKPLWLDHRLYRCAAAVMSSNAVVVRNYFYQKSKFFQICYHCLTCFVTVHTSVFSTKLVDGRIVIHNVDLFQIVTASNLKVVRVMGRCDLYTSCSEFFVYIFIGDHRNLSVCERKLQHLADEILVALIFRIYGNSSITQQGFRTCSCNLYETSLFPYDRVINVPEKSVLILMLNLCIRDGSLAYRTPVDDSGTFIDIAFFI